MTDIFEAKIRNLAEGKNTMKDTIEAKILDLVNYIVDKPIAEMTLDDYTILTNELREIHNQESQAANGQRMAELMGLLTSNSACANLNITR